MKHLILLLSLLFTLNAQILKDTQLKKIEKEKEKNVLEAELLKKSWINPLSIDADISKNKSSNTKTTNKRIYLDFNQDIFRSAGIYYTIQKANKLNKLANENYLDSLNTKKNDTYKLVLEIRKIDLQIKKQAYLIKNKSIEIEKRQDQYINGTVSIEDLDVSVIEQNELKNEIEDLKISKYKILNELKKYTSISYKNIKVSKLEIIGLKQFLEKNKKLIINKINTSISNHEQNITDSNYLPKVSLYSQLGYEDVSNEPDNKSFYNYGLKISIPLDYNMNKNKEISKINYKLSKIEQTIKKDDETNNYKNTLQLLKHIEKKISNTHLTINKFERIYSLTNDLVKGLIKTKEDLQVIENRLNSNRLDIDILNIDKQVLIYEINKDFI